MKNRLFIRKTILSYLNVSILLLILTDLFVLNIPGNRYVLFVLFSLLFVTILLNILQTKRIKRSIEEITAFTKEVSGGKINKHLSLDERDELGELGKNISDMARELRSKAIQSETEKFMTEAILRNLSDGLMLINVNGKILLCNEAFKGLLSVESNVEGRTLVETIRSAELMELISKVVEKEETESCEIEITHPKELYLLTTATPFYSDSLKKKVSGIVLTLHDITRLRHLEEVRKDFVANVSHEIKTPITAIKGFAETLLEGAIDDKENAYKFLETIRSHSERLNSLVNDLLTLSRIELGDIKIEKTSIGLDDLVDSVFTTLNEKALSKGLFLKKQIPQGSHEIFADRNRLIQVILNLVDNGIKFTEYGGVTVGIEKTGKKNVLFVKDTGEGIEKRHLSRLGERFYRVDRARSRELGGTGLGLAIVKHLVKAHGWDMEIETTLGKGTKVKIIIEDSKEKSISR
jgi:two-component system phosphate regulon sensor histidine kinase PhoR